MTIKITRHTFVVERTEGPSFKRVAWNKEIEAGKPSFGCKLVGVLLSAFYGRPCMVQHIVAGVNRSNGYPVCAFGFVFLDDQGS